MAKQIKKFQIRSAAGDVLGEYTEKQILSRIAKGKFSGGEEVAEGPHGKWKELSSHPAFYDEFLKRLYKSEYVAPEGGKSRGEEKSHPSVSGESSEESAPKKTRRAKKSAEPENPESDRNAGTHHQGTAIEGRGTVHQSDIDALFSSGSQAGSAPRADDGGLLPKDSEGSRSRHPLERSLSIVLPGTREVLPSFSVDIKPEPAETPPEVKEVRSVKKNRRLLIWGAVGALLLVLLFQSGKTPVLKQEASDDLNGPISEMFASDRAVEEKVLYLGKTSLDWYARDSALFYSAAWDMMNQAIRIKENDANVLASWCEVASQMLFYSPQPEKIATQLSDVLTRGRASDPHRSQFYRAEARLALFRKNLDLAKRSITSALESDPNQGLSSMVLGEVYLQQNEFLSAKLSLQEALASEPDLVRAHRLLSEIALAQKDFAGARKHALEALKRNPLHAFSYYVLAEVTKHEGDLRKSHDLYESAAKLAKFGERSITAKSFNALAAEIRDKKSNVSDSDRERAKKYSRLGEFYLTEAKPAETANAAETPEKESREIAQLEEEFLYGRLYFVQRGEILVRENKAEKSFIFFEAANLLKPKEISPLIRIGELREDAFGANYDDLNDVAQTYRRAIELSPNTALPYIKLGILETNRYHFDRGYRLLTQAVALTPDRVEPYVALGKHYYKRQDYNAALAQLLKATEINQSEPDVLYYAGLLRLLVKSEGSTREAMTLFNKAYTLNSQNYEALAEWLKLKAVNYEKTFAIKFVKNLLADDPKNANYFWVLGEIYAANKEYQRAILYYHDALDLDNKSSRTRLSLAKAWEAVGNTDKAIGEYRWASQLDRRNGDGYFKAANLMLQIKKYDVAEETLRTLLKAIPLYPGVHLALSKVYQAQNKRDLALEQMKEEVVNNPANAKFRITLAELWMEYEKYPEAIAELTEITNLPHVTKAPEYIYDKIRAYLLLSRCYRTQNKLESAEGVIRLALDIDADDPELHRELGYIYHGLQRDKEGVTAFRFYLDHAPAARDTAAIKDLIQHMEIDE